MRLDDAQIERYSRQIVLAEIGAEGQCRLLEARVVVVGTPPVASDVIAQLGAAGVGTIATPPDIDAELGNHGDDGFDVMALIDASPTAHPAATHTLWLADGRIGETPPCAVCAARALPPPPVCDAELRGARDSLLGALLAAEIIKRLVGVGTSLAGHALTYDPATAGVTVESVTPDPACTRCTARPPED